MKRITWTAPAKADVRALSKIDAMRVLTALHRFEESGIGDVKTLQGREDLRLRIGDYRLVFVYSDASGIEIRRVLHRREAYR